MDISYIVFILVGVFLLFIIAFPERFITLHPVKKKKVGASYWGFYQNEVIDQSEEEKTIEIAVTKNKEKVVGGSTRYGGGRGISFRGG